MSIIVLELYPHHLAVNGDMGNNIVLDKRMSLAGVPTTRVGHEPGDELPERVDIVTIGTGPESALRAVAEDVARIAPTLRAWAADGVPFLAVTAGMHLLGQEVGMRSGSITGAGVFPLTTAPRAARALSHSFIVDSPFGRLIGVENHGAVVTVHDAEPLGAVVKGIGNGDGSEGIRTGNAIGTHMHGPVLAMNPLLADHIIGVAAGRAGLEYLPGDAHRRIDGIARQTRAHLAKMVDVAIDV